MDISKQIEELSRFAIRHNYAGWDPYDALNSPLVDALTFRTKYARIAWIQLFRRLPINFRPLFFTPKGHNPKGLGLFLGGYARLSALDPSPEYAKNIKSLFQLLEGTKSQGYSGNCWGYNFDWQNRAFFVPKYTPTIVNSAFIGHALLDAYMILQDQSFLDASISIKEFILNDLNRIKSGDTFSFSYTPIDYRAVHNANLLGASLLIRLHTMTGEETIRDAALSSLAYSMKHQRADGSWFYSESDTERWIDSFHTGFNLESLRWFKWAGEAKEYKQKYELGRQYYSKMFFLGDGTPKYYHDRTYPIDIHAPTEAISFFAGEGEEFSELTDNLLQWLLKNMRDPRGYFYFRKTRWYTNKIPYMRWAEAWAFRALTEYQFNRLEAHGAENNILKIQKQW